jgi:hypothetical protein
MGLEINAEKTRIWLYLIIWTQDRTRI